MRCLSLAFPAGLGIVKVAPPEVAAKRTGLTDQATAEPVWPSGKALGW